MNLRQQQAMTLMVLVGLYMTKYGRIIQHGGTQPGTSAFFSIYLDHKMVSTVLSNSFGSRQNAFYLSSDIAHLALEE